MTGAILVFRSTVKANKIPDQAQRTMNIENINTYEKERRLLQPVKPRFLDMSQRKQVIKILIAIFEKIINYI